MAILKKIGELPNLSSQLVAMNGNNAVGVIALENEAYTANMSDIMEGIGKIVEFNTLDTGNQTIIGAINEIYAFMHNYVVFCTQAEYDALTTYENKLYLITDASAGNIDEVIGNTILEVESQLSYVPAYKFRYATGSATAGQPAGTFVSMQRYHTSGALSVVGNYAFSGHDDLVSVTWPKAAWIEEGITNFSCGEGCFYLCSSLEKFGFEEDNYLGITTTPITVGSTTSTITINGESVTVQAGDVVYDSVEIDCFRWTGSAWEDYSPTYTIDGGGTATGTQTSHFTSTKVAYFNWLLNTTAQYRWKMPKVVRLSYNPSYTGRTNPNANTFEGNAEMQRLDCWNTMSAISANNVFAGCSKLKILKLPYNGVVSISAANLSATKIGQGTADAKVYVPSAKISAYQTATNWADAYALAMANGNQLFYPID